MLTAIVALPGGYVFADEYTLSDDPILSKPLEMFREAQQQMERGDGAYRNRKGRALKHYLNARGLVIDAKELYKKLGLKHEIDVQKELAACEDLYREVNVKASRTKRKIRRHDM
jgi:hypothetical protein